LRSGIEKAVVDHVTIATAASAKLFIATSIVSIYLKTVYRDTVGRGTKKQAGGGVFTRMIRKS